MFDNHIVLRAFLVLVKGLAERKIVQIACGPQHAIALDSDGCVLRSSIRSDRISFLSINVEPWLNSRVFVWGYNGYCRLGLGNQVDALVPKQVPQFAGPNEITMGAHVVAGPSNSVVVDKQGMYWMAGKWKTTGDGTTSLPSVCSDAFRALTPLTMQVLVVSRSQRSSSSRTSCT